MCPSLSRPDETESRLRSFSETRSKPPAPEAPYPPSESLVIKGGRKGTGIHDYIWIGDSVVDASKLSSQGNRNGFKTICMSSCFYDNIKEFNANDDHKYSYYCSSRYSPELGENIYQCEMINIQFDNWIQGGMNG